MLPDYRLLEAVRFGQVQDAIEAIGAGADVNARDFQKRPALWVAASEGHLEIMDLLLRHGADVSVRLGRRKQSLLHWAAENSAVGVATVLLRHGVDVNARMTDGITPLMLAAREGHFYMADKLLQADALLSPRSRSGRTARSLADRNGHSSIVSLIDKAERTRPAYLQAAERTLFTGEPDVPSR